MDVQKSHTEWLSEINGALVKLAEQMHEGFVKIAAANKDTRHNLNIQRLNLNIQRENLNILFRTVQDMIPRLPKQ